MDSPRLESLGKHLQEWFNQFSDEDFKDSKTGIDVIVFAHDNLYKNVLQFTCVNKEDPIESLVQTINHGIGNPFENKDSRKLFNAILEYYINIFIQYPKLYERFKQLVENGKQ